MVCIVKCDSAITEELRIEASFIVNLSLSAVTLRAMMVTACSAGMKNALYIDLSYPQWYAYVHTYIPPLSIFSHYICTYIGFCTFVKMHASGNFLLIITPTNNAISSMA